MFCHLHTHSYFSLQEAVPSPVELVQAAQAEGMPALALTDHLYLTGVVEFYQGCRQFGIRPVLGMEIDLAIPAKLGVIEAQVKPGPIVLLATSLEGWGNLCWLSSAILNLAEAEDHAGNFIPCQLDPLAKHSQGLIALTGGRASLVNQLCLSGEMAAARKWLTELSSIFPDRLYVELQANSQDDQRTLPLLSRLVVEQSLPAVATHPVYYLKSRQAGLQRLLTAIRRNQPIAQLSPSDIMPEGSGWASTVEMENRFSPYPAALAATQEIADLCQFDLAIGRPFFPVVPVPDGLTPVQYLRFKAEDGARKLYHPVTPDIQARLDNEIEVIAQRGFEPIFLIMEELLRFARQADIPFSSRGSAASSLVAHCLGITSPDPIGLNLYFERFLNPARTTPPDIDTDLCSRRRDLVIQHVFETYGAERVAMVGTINRYRPRSAIGDVAKAHGLPPEKVRDLVNRVPYRFFWGRPPEDSNTPEDPFVELKREYLTGPYHNIIQEAGAILGLPRHLSMHAGGIVISPGEMTERVPLMRSGGKGVTITQMDLEAIEQLGLVKMDLLGIRGLSVMGDVADAIRSWHSSEYKSSTQVIEQIPLEDKETSDLIQNGRTIGCFQIESPGMRATLKEIHARSQADLLAALALYRPGPLNGGLKDAFVRRFKGEEPTIHLHPALEPLLNETFGVIVYQEQVLRIAHSLAGFSLAEADLLRRGMSQGGAHAHANHPGDRMSLLRDKFLAGAWETSRVDKETASRIWDLMAAFAGYGFPKAHAASYAEIAWHLAWCKVHYPAEFMAAVLANWGGYYPQRVYLMEARRFGLAVHPPHINHSQHNFSVSYHAPEPQLYMGLDQVKDLTHRTQDRIIRQRPFSTLDDFLARVDPRRAEAEALIMVGALNDLGNIPTHLSRLKQGGWQASQMNLFEWATSVESDWTLNEKVAAQEAILGVGIDAHPLELIADKVVDSGAITTQEAASKPEQKVRIAGVRQTMHRSRTSKGETIAFLTLEDLEGMLDVIFFPDAYRRSREALTSTRPILIEGTIGYETNTAEPVLRADRAWKLVE